MYEFLVKFEYSLAIIIVETETETGTEKRTKKAAFPKPMSKAKTPCEPVLRYQKSELIISD